MALRAITTFKGAVRLTKQSLFNCSRDLRTLTPALSVTDISNFCPKTSQRDLFCPGASLLCNGKYLMPGNLVKNFSVSSPVAAKVHSDKGDLVYTGAISGMIKGVKLFSLSTSLMGLCLQPVIFFNNQEMPAGLKFAFGGMINFFVFINPFIIHYIAKKYVKELRWNKATGVFTAVTYSFFLQRKELEFKAYDVRVPDVPGMFTFLEAKGVALFLDPAGFQDNEAYVHLMGFDKPLDWELPPPPGKNQDDKK